MKSKTLIGGLIAGVLSYLFGWFVFGILLKGYFDANTFSYPGLMRIHPFMWALIIANLSWGLLLAYILDIAGANTVAKGFICGFIVFFLLTMGIDMFFLAFMKLMRLRLAAVEIVSNAFMGGLLGSLVGWWYSRENRAVASYLFSDGNLRE